MLKSRSLVPSSGSVDGPLPTPCLIWQGGLWPNGYAKTSISGRTRLGHRLAYELANDVRLTKAQVVSHHCDRPQCVAPNHLFLTDAKGNAMDSALATVVTDHKHHQQASSSKHHAADSFRVSGSARLAAARLAHIASPAR
jgi:hypothetical protein